LRKRSHRVIATCSACRDFLAVAARAVMSCGPRRHGPRGRRPTALWLASAVAFAEQLDAWRDFYLALAGAAAVLLGLVYIALSLHLQKVEEPRVPVLGLGAQALLNHGNALLLSLAMLVPFRPPVLPGVAIVAVALNGLVNSLNLLRRGRRLRAPRLRIRTLAVPLLVPMGLALVLLAGGLLAIARQEVSLYLLPAAGVGLLLSAMQNTWWVLLYGRRTGPG